MKKIYTTPKAIKVDYSFDTNVVAASLTCSGSYWVYQTESGCNAFKYTDYQKTRSAHPCDYTLEGQKYPS